MEWHLEDDLQTLGEQRSPRYLEVVVEPNMTLLSLQFRSKTMANIDSSTANDILNGTNAADLIRG
jgi:hypothetical protein